MKKITAALLLTIISSFTSTHAQIKPSNVEAGIYASVGVVFAASAALWASHAKCAWNVDTSRDNRTNKMIHKFVFLSSAFASVAFASASCTSFKVSYDLWQSNY